MEKFIKLRADKIKLFEIPLELKEIQKDVKIQINLIEELENTVRIDALAFLQADSKPKNLKILYNKNKLTAYQSIFVGWSYFVKYETNEENEKYKNKAKEYLLYAIENGAKSCLPHYLLSKYPIGFIKYPNSIDRICFAADNYQDVFPEIYSLIYSKDENKIRGLGFLKKGLDKFPNDIDLLLKYTNHLIKKGKYNEALWYLLKANFKDKKIYIFNLKKYYINVIISYLKLKKFKEAKEAIDKTNVFYKYDRALFYGILNFAQKKFKESAKKLIEYIENDYSEKYKTTALYYLLNVYYELNDLESLIDIIILLNKDIKNIYESFLFWEGISLDEPESKINFKNIAETTLGNTIKLELTELDKARVGGLLAFFIFFYKVPSFEIKESSRKLTKHELDLINEAESLMKTAIQYYPDYYLYSAIYSNILFLKGNFDEAEKIKIRNFVNLKNEDTYVDTFVSIKDCSAELISNYLEELKIIFQINPECRNIYIEKQYSEDIEDLYDLKEYKLIANIHNYLEPTFELHKVKPLFKLACSLAENNYLDQAIYLYNKEIDINGESSAAYNNLALLYEEKGDIKEAIKIIKKAKNISKDNDLIVDSNYRRLIYDEKGLRQIKDSSSKGQRIKPELQFDTEKSRIFYGNKFCEIPISTYEYYLCKAIFSKPLGTKIPEEEIFEVLDRAKLEERSRTIYDTCLRINKKVESSLGLKKILINRGAMIWIRDEFIK